jgi:hypothetical protein
MKLTEVQVEELRQWARSREPNGRLELAEIAHAIFAVATDLRGFVEFDGRSEKFLGECE